MGVVRNLLVRVGADFSELQREMARAGKFMKNAGKDLQNIGKGLTLGLTVPILGIGIAGLKTASDLKEVQNVVDTAFGESAKSVNTWAKNALNAYGLTELQAKQFAGTMRAMTGSMGLSSVEADKMSMSLAGLSGDMASFYNISQEDAFDKLRSGISGETEPLKALGINMSVANMEAYALAKGIKTSWKEMTSAEQATLRYSYLMDSTKNVQGDFSKTSGSFANQLRVIKGMFTDISGQLMSQFIPYFESVFKKIQEGLNWFRSLSDSQKDLFVKFALVAAAIGPVIMLLGVLTSTISSIMLWGSGVSKALIAVQAGTKGVGVLLTAVFGPAGIVLLAVAGIAVLVAGVVYLWKTNENFKNAIINIWNAIVAFITPILAFIKDIAIKAWNDIYTLAIPYISSLKDFIINSWNFIRNNVIPVLINIKDSIISAFNYAWVTLQPIIQGIKDMLSAAWDFILVALKLYLDLLKTVWTVGFEALKVIFTTIFNYLKLFWNTWGSNIISFFKNIWDTVIGVFKGVISIFTGMFQIFTGLLSGNWSKVWEGMKNIFIGIWDSMKAVLKGGINFFLNGINGMINGVNGIKMPKWVPGIGGMGFNIPNIPMLANGGIATKPTLAMVGEGKESEAILPLSKLDKLMNGNKNSSPLFVIENFNNHTDKDIETLAYQIEFFRRKASISLGGE